MRLTNKTERLNIRLTLREMQRLEMLAERLATTKTGAVVSAVESAIREQAATMAPAAQEGEGYGEKVGD